MDDYEYYEECSTKIYHVVKIDDFYYKILGRISGHGFGICIFKSIDNKNYVDAFGEFHFSITDEGIARYIDYFEFDGLSECNIEKMKMSLYIFYDMHADIVGNIIGVQDKDIEFN
jgi:hypothetical protein